MLSSCSTAVAAWIATAASDPAAATTPEARRLMAPAEPVIMPERLENARPRPGKPPVERAWRAGGTHRPPWLSRGSRGPGGLLDPTDLLAKAGDRFTDVIDRGRGLVLRRDLYVEF